MLSAKAVVILSMTRGVDDVKLLEIVALDGREGRLQEVADGLFLGWFNLEVHQAFAPRNSFKKVGEEYVETDQHVFRGNIRNVERLLAVEHAHVLCRQWK